MFKYLVIIGVQISLCIYYINTWRSVHNSLSISLFGYVKIYIIYNLILTSFNIYTPIKHRGWEPTDTSDPNQSTAADLHCLQPGDLSSDCQCKDDIAGKNLRETPPIDGRITGIMGFQHLPAYLTVSVSAIRPYGCFSEHYLAASCWSRSSWRAWIKLVADRALLSKALSWMNGWTNGLKEGMDG